MFECKHPSGVLIGRSSSRSEVETIDGVTYRDMGTGYGWYDLPVAQIMDKWIYCSVCFGTDGVARISLCASSTNEPASLSNRSQAAEQLAVQETQDWLRAIGYPPGNYDWGMVWACLDPKTGDGGGGVRYDR